MIYDFILGDIIVDIVREELGDEFMVLGQSDPFWPVLEKILLRPVGKIRVVKEFDPIRPLGEYAPIWVTMYRFKVVDRDAAAFYVQGSWDRQVGSDPKLERFAIDEDTFDVMREAIDWGAFDK